MERTLRLLNLREVHTNLALDLVRIFLGLALFVRGYVFMTNQELLASFMDSQGLLIGGFIVHIVTLAHLYGGFIMAFGLLTRVSAMIQIPVLVGAVYTHLSEGLLAQGQSLELAVLVLFLLIIIFVWGSGKVSLDYFFFVRPHRAEVIDTEEEVTARESDHVSRAERIATSRAYGERAHSTPHSDIAVIGPLPGGPIEPRWATDTASDARSKTIAKYAALLVFGGILFFSMIFLDAVPIGLEMVELMVIGGVVTLIFGLFWLFYKSAFQR